MSDLIPGTTRRCASRNGSNISLVRINNSYFINTFLPSTTTEWNNLDLTIRSSTSLNMYKDRLLQFVKPLENGIYTCHNPIGIKDLARLRLGFSHLRYYKFKYGFLDVVDPFL